MVNTALPVTLEQVQAAAGTIQGVAVRTPLVQLGPNLYAKPESLQKTGSFKFRGAFNAVSKVPPEVRARGVVTSSSGNHAQGVAAAASLHGVPAVIVIPENAPRIKVDRTLSWGAEVIRYGKTSDEGRELAERIGLERGLTFIPPFDHEHIIAGQGTIGLEIVEDLPEVQNVFVCIGGGGLISGIAVAIKSLRPNARVIGVEPELAADAQESLRSGKRVRWDSSLTTRTICDGVRTNGIGERNFAIISSLVERIVTVSEISVLEAMRWYAIEAKLAVEPTGALTLAAVRTAGLTLEGPTVLVISGGNFDPALMARVLEGSQVQTP